ncbi:class I SAM-dependent methyltransferase [Leucobacter sp. cx-328]|uniref:class I SAM-dependent methyltransferase n=1 Tax=unclassified Leucobacter TaxID=2621730 RepID=UPI00165D6266|nr:MULTISPECIES: class I SAM-dependent methyltransferase [unclassified Leucobacter]MBC9944651.1 class I SAM-dependent methyltransferase [Leucobacter sp. cx-328]
MALSVNSFDLTLPPISDAVRSVDVCFDGDRVWSIDLVENERSDEHSFPWPISLRPYLRGSTHLTVLHSATGEALAAGEVEFTADAIRAQVRDADNIPLAVNKWGMLGKTLEAGNPGVQERILDRSAEIIGHLRDMGLRPFVVGGTLLGGVREGELLPHDDDADVAYLSEFTNPADVAREGFQVGHALIDLGYELVRHSATHMQLYFRTDSGLVDHYVDVFTAFFTDDGKMNQPFHVRGDLREDQILPFGTVTIAGREFPAPADPEAWLVINYDENWRTPIPGYRLQTPESTSRRFNAWFGSFHFGRDFWNAWFLNRGAEADLIWADGADWILEQSAELTSPVLLEFGAGNGALSERLALVDTGRRVIATDYSYAALQLAQERSAAAATPFETAHVNLYRTLSLAAPKQQGITGRFDVVANHVFEQLGHLARENLLRLIRMALRSGGSACATLYASPAEDVTFADPTTWHLNQFELANAAHKFGLSFEYFTPATQIPTMDRRPYGVRFVLSDHPFPTQEVSMRQRLKRLFMRTRPAGTRAQLDALTNRITELEDELDEYRRNSLRVAELMDLAEQSFRADRPASDNDSHNGPSA